MNPTIQSGMHPDAESLTAFAEQLLPATERDQILAHMATCSRCREVVFLSQKAAEEDHPHAVAAVKEKPTKRRDPWFHGWRWAWVPVAALAAFVGVAVLQHFRHPAESTQVATNTSATDALQKMGPTSTASPKTAPSADSAAVKSESLQSTRQAAKRDDVSRQVAKDVKPLEEKKSVERNELAAVTGGASVALAPKPSEGSIHGTISARAKASAIGGPAAANQFQQQNLEQQNLAQQNLAQQNSMLKAQNVPADADNKGVQPRAAQRATSETVTVQADKSEPLPTPAPASAAPVFSIPLTDEYDGSLSSAGSKQKAIRKITLPSGLGVLASASEASRIVALDTAGALFLSEDGGKKWQTIQTQWTGRAMLVRTRPVGTDGGALRAPQTVRFELVNDKLQTWFSYDGKTWTAQLLPAN